MFDKYIEDWVLGLNVCIETYTDIEEADKRRNELEKEFNEVCERLRLKGKLKIRVYCDRSLNYETRDTEYRVTVEVDSKEIRRAVSKK